MTDFKLIHTADWQFGQTSIPNSMQRQESALLELCEFALSENIKEIIVVGDIFQRHIPSQFEKDSLLSILFEFERSNINLRLIPGNHDRETIGNYHSLHTFNILNKGTFFSNILVYDKPGVYNINNLYNLVIIDDEEPIIPPQNINDLPTILAYHGIVSGAVSSNKYQFTEGLPLDKLILRCPISLDYIALGDIHLRQQIIHSIPTYYSGAIVQQTFGESSSGFILVSFENGKLSDLQECEIESVPRVLTLEKTVNDTFDNLNFPAWDAGYILKIVFQCTAEQKRALKLSSLKKKLLKENDNVLDIVWGFKLQSTTSKVRRTQNISSVSSIEDDFDIFLEMSETDLDHNKLKSLFNEVIKTVESNQNA